MYIDAEGGYLYRDAEGGYLYRDAEGGGACIEMQKEGLPV